MAAKRINSSVVNWAFITETLTNNDRAVALSLKAQSEKYLREVASRPAELPQINWSFYKSRISNAAMVDTFQKSYQALKIPYPSGQAELTAAEASNNKINAGAKQKYDDVLKDIEQLKTQLSELEKIMKYSEMTVEEFFLARPDMKIDPDNPKFFPQFFDFDKVNEKD